MKRIPVIVIFDIGKTNKKVLVFDEQYEVVHEHSARFEETTDEDGFACEDLAALERFIFDSLHAVFCITEFEIRAVNFSAYGSALVYIGDDGKPLAPLYNYLKPYPEKLRQQFFETHGGEDFLSRKAASKIEGSLNAGLQLYRLKYENPKIFKKIKWALFLPQYLSYLLTGNAQTEMTSIGCHTGLWDFERKDYQDWVEREGILEKLPPLVSSETEMLVSLESRKFFTGAGMHDSSAALVPYINKCKEPFLLISTGTWCVSMNPFGSAVLSDEKLSEGCLCYMSSGGRPVKASRSMLGKKYGEGMPMDLIIYEQIRSARMAMDGSDIKQIFVDGGFAKNEEYMQCLGQGFKGMNIHAAELPHASALGAAMVIREHILMMNK